MSHRKATKKIIVDREMYLVSCIGVKLWFSYDISVIKTQSDIFQSELYRKRIPEIFISFTFNTVSWSMDE